MTLFHVCPTERRILAARYAEITVVNSLTAPIKHKNVIVAKVQLICLVNLC